MILRLRFRILGLCGLAKASRASGGAGASACIAADSRSAASRSASAAIQARAAGKVQDSFRDAWLSVESIDLLPLLGPLAWASLVATLLRRTALIATHQGSERR